MFIVYQVTNKIDGKFYVGFTTQSNEKRWKGHIASSKNPKTYFHRSIRKYGPESFLVSVLEEGWSPEIGKNIREPYWIAILKPEYNMTAGGDGKLGFRWSPEGKEKLRQGTLEYFKKPGTLEKHRLAMWGPEVKADRVKTLFGRTWKHKCRIVECIHCHKVGGANNMTRYHFNNCKQRGK